MKLEFSQRIFENIRIPNIMKICSVGGELFHADGQTDMTNLIVAFRYFANAPKNVKEIVYKHKQQWFRLASYMER